MWQPGTRGKSDSFVFRLLGNHNESQIEILYNMRAIVGDNDFWAWSEKAQSTNNDTEKYKNVSNTVGSRVHSGPFGRW
jgi:hypothetical protein